MKQTQAGSDNQPATSHTINFLELECIHATGHRKEKSSYVIVTVVFSESSSIKFYLLFISFACCDIQGRIQYTLKEEFLPICEEGNYSMSQKKVT